ARSIAAQVGPADLDRLASGMAPDVEYHDHRLVGAGAVHGIGEFRDVVRTLFEAATDVANRADDILALRPDALLVRWMNSRTDRAGGGAFERRFLMLELFGADGLKTRIEQFDIGRETEALARFDELTAERMPPRPVQRRMRPNAATVTGAR